MNGKIMWPIGFVITLFFFSPETFGQDNSDVQSTIKYFEDGIKAKDMNLIRQSLSTELTIGAYKQPLVEQVIAQIIAQYPQLESIAVIELKETSVFVEYKFSGLPPQTSEIYLDEKDKIRKIALFDAIVEQSSTVQSSEGQNLIDAFTTDFKLTSNLILVKAKLNDIDEWFILDSGAPAIILNTKKETTEGTELIVQGVSGGSTVKSVWINSFDWNGILLDSTKVLGMDLSHLEEQCGVAFKGLIGYNILKDYELVIDYKNSQLTLFSEGNSSFHKEIEPSGALEYTLVNHIPVIEVGINKKKYHFGLDTGAAANLLSSELFEKLDERNYKVLEQSGLTGADDNLTIVETFSLKKCKVEKRVYRKMLFVSSSINHLVEQGIEVDGLLGYPFLSEGLMSINFSSNTIYFWD